MKFGFYHDAAGTRQAGGIAIYTQHMAAELAKTNDVYLYTREGSTAEILERSDVTIIETPSIDTTGSTLLESVTPLSSQDVEKLEMTGWSVRNGVFDHMTETLDLLFTYQFLDDLLVSNLTDVPTVYTFHSLSSIGLGSRLRDRFSQTELILANSNPTARTITDMFGYDVDEIIYPGVDHAQFTPEADPAFLSDQPSVLFVGRLIAEKGVFDLLEAIALLDQPVDLHLIGSGNEAAIRSRCQELGIEDSVVLEGEVSHLALPGYYATADVFCLPTYDESFGMVNVEAMACGTPLVTTALDGIETYATHTENALLVEPGEPTAIADSLETILSNPDYRRRMGHQAREDAKRFSWREQARRLERFAADVLGVPIVEAYEPTRPAEIESD